MPHAQVPTPAPAAQHLRTRLLGTLLFGCAMGLLEAICVIYLRRLIVPEGTDPTLPVTPLDRLYIESLREACTLVMLLTVAWLAGNEWRSRTAYFFFMFGVWDIVYYLGLKWLADWPASWLQWDCLFLIPKAWYGPVLAPVLISVYLMAACCLWLALENSARRPRLPPAALSLQLPGFLLWYGSFVKDSDRIVAHGYTGVSYSWAWFAGALCLAVLGLWLAARLGHRQHGGRGRS